jgi:hypothetical protein
MEGSKSKFKDSLDALNAQISEIEDLLNDEYGACEVSVDVPGYVLWWTQSQLPDDPWTIRIESDESVDAATTDPTRVLHLEVLLKAPAKRRVEAAVHIPHLVKELEIEINKRIQGIESVTDLLKQLCVDLILE